MLIRFHFLSSVPLPHMFLGGFNCISLLHA
uniref:Uncharacterized protein n=1 Tax=Rhizophora mucronata TaxID=61149 RepID=A0A2P2NCC4_RHIMU